MSNNIKSILTEEEKEHLLKITKIAANVLNKEEYKNIIDVYNKAAKRFCKEFSWN